MKSIFVLGASSWIGHDVCIQLQKDFSDFEIIGTYQNHRPNLPIKLLQTHSRDYSPLVQILKTYRPKIIFNLLRGEDLDTFQLHQELCQITRDHDSYYAYFSSFNALDANLNSEHYEDEVPNAQSDYGRFKAKCEQELNNLGNNFVIFRFAATHGYAPFRLSRTESFLQKLKNGEKIVVEQGIVQNRTSTRQLALMVSSVAKNQGKGVFHLGTIEPSCEISFLQKLATSFGYEKERVEKGPENKCNAFMVPKKIFELCGDGLKFTEDEAIKDILAIKELSSYISV